MCPTTYNDVDFTMPEYLPCILLRSIQGKYSGMVTLPPFTPEHPPFPR